MCCSLCNVIECWCWKKIFLKIFLRFTKIIISLIAVITVLIGNSCSNWTFRLFCVAYLYHNKYNNLLPVNTHADFQFQFQWTFSFLFQKFATSRLPFEQSDNFKLSWFVKLYFKVGLSPSKKLLYLLQWKWW